MTDRPARGPQDFSLCGFLAGFWREWARLVAHGGGTTPRKRGQMGENGPVLRVSCGACGPYKQGRSPEVLAIPARPAVFLEL